MEAQLVSKMQTTTLRNNDKRQTDFAKDAPRISRYSLADKASSRGEMDYHFRIITAEDKENVLKFLRRFFFRDEPLNHSIRLIPDGENSTCVELEDYSMSSIDDNLSMMAVSASGEIIGVLLNGVMEPPTEGEPEYVTNCENPKFKKILKLLCHVDKKAGLAKKFPDQRVLELRIISVDGTWRGRGVAKALVERTENLAKDLGFDVLRCDCSSFYSGKLCQRLGFETTYALPYAEYVDEDGKPIFTPSDPHAGIVTYVKKI
ncbi:arylalkylamine N-acetyltransferase 1-like isoform X1 [Diprion similis]|uniref:arylalkylamine N-acetyltransferase 1-like isoform X1 n=2 Tax=Diprion similis TaxID=362088 RepID=UPI001EF9AC16|nr:arylalkylamine N-acetyltransferase 1-like isoform X1 [Diprion similis]